MNGEKELTYREGTNKCVWPYNVIDVSGKIVHIKVPSPNQRFPLELVKKYLRNDEATPDGTVLGGMSSQVPHPQKEPIDYERVSETESMERNEFRNLMDTVFDELPNIAVPPVTGDHPITSDEFYNYKICL